MGNREDLLAGAKRCLYEKGYARTTVRDIAAASGVSMAAIGYHYGSKEALLNQALREATGEWGAEIQRSLAASPKATGEPIEQFEAIWTSVIESFAAHRQLWAATFEVLGQLDHVPQIREQLAEGLRQGRAGLSRPFEDSDAPEDDKTGAAIGSFYQALMTGVMAQWLIDPESAPSGHDLAVALRAITDGVR